MPTFDNDFIIFVSLLHRLGGSKFTLFRKGGEPVDFACDQSGRELGNRFGCEWLEPVIAEVLGHCSDIEVIFIAYRSHCKSFHCKSIRVFIADPCIDFILILYFIARIFIANLVGFSLQIIAKSFNEKGLVTAPVILCVLVVVALVLTATGHLAHWLMSLAHHSDRCSPNLLK